MHCEIHIWYMMHVVSAQDCNACYGLIGMKLHVLYNLVYICTPNANMADHSVSARDELHESEVSQSLMFCFGNASPENYCFVIDLLCLILLCLRVAVFLNASRNRNLSLFTLKGKM